MVREAAATGKCGRQCDCSEAAIQTCLTMKVLSGMALRQPPGRVESVLRLIGRERGVHYFSALSQRQTALNIRIPYCGWDRPLQLLVDSTAIKIAFEGE